MDNISINNLIRFTTTGLDVAEYYQIRKVLTDVFKSIYGNDIDVSTNNADGVYIECLSLMINNILQTVKSLYKNLDIETASGYYLDSLCALSGIYRKDADYSRASIEVTNNDETDLVITSSSPLFVDNAGMIWTPNVTIGTIGQTTIESGDTKTIEVICLQKGKVNAPAGWISKTADTSYNLTIVQSANCILGREIETDAQLRARRNSILTGTNQTVLEGLTGALLNISGIDDVKIYNNNTASTMTANDGTSIATHDQYIVIRQNTDIEDEEIANTIYNKLTPGIKTTQSAIVADRKSYEIPVISDYNTTIYWKKATPSTLSGTNNFEVEITTFDRYDDNTDLLIKQAIQNYLNGLALDDTFDTTELSSMIEDNDPRFNGRKTFRVTNVTVTDTNLTTIISDGSYKAYKLKDTYYNISDLTNITVTKVSA